ncbi:unnamed protein product [Paramecium primaurelia]|uniref:Protein kinase domain-containing protein n=1 Tax=Paramecium primaurelia TaxID=5886 RepID=A0A8S1MGX3_PARPR|nr:unnamed protein product [Paramecium primaurelia]
MEYCNQNLLHYFKSNLQQLDNQQIIQFMKQIIKGYQQLIEQGVLHRDLKPENIYYIKNNNNILFKIGGFEYSKLLDDRDQPIDENTKLQCQGYYQAPEQCMHNYSFNADIYSFGLILFEMVTKQKLQNLNQLKTKNLQDIFNLDNIDSTIKNFLCRMIVYDHQKRITWSLLIKDLFYKLEQSIGPNEKVISKENGQQLFIKIIQKPKKNNEYYLEFNGKQELLINRLFKGKDHPNIVKIHEVLHEPESTHILIIMENCDGNLENLLKYKQFDALEILDLASQINKGYQILEQENIIHRDIKPENILYKNIDNQILYKITDFGVSRIADEACSKCGTSLYAAPEVKGTCTYTNKCDIYSLGIVFYYLATQKYTQENKIKQLVQTLNEKKFIEKCYPSDLVLDETIKTLINKMIILDANKRINWGKEMDDLIQSLKNQLSPKKQLFHQQPLFFLNMIPNINQQQLPQMQKNNSINNMNYNNNFPKQFVNQTPNSFQNNFNLDQKPKFPINQFNNNINQRKEPPQFQQNQPRQIMQNSPSNNLDKNQTLNHKYQSQQGIQYFLPKSNLWNQQDQKKFFNQNKTISFFPNQNNQEFKPQHN